MEDTTTAHCRYRHMDNGIHEFEVMGESRQAVDEFFALREQLQHLPQEGITLILLHSRMNRLPSINHVVAHVREANRRYPHAQPSRTAIIYQRGMLIMVLNNVLKTFMRSKDKVQFFTEAEQDKAIAWLLAYQVRF